MNDLFMFKPLYNEHLYPQTMQLYHRFIMQTIQ